MRCNSSFANSSGRNTGGGMVPKAVTYRAHGVTIKSGGTFQFPITVARGDGVSWRFSTRGGDIAFGVGVDDGSEVRTLVASERMRSDETKMTGEVTVDGNGVVVLVWDNSHAWSWSAPKFLTYAVEVSPLGACAGESLAGQRGQRTVSVTYTPGVAPQLGASSQSHSGQSADAPVASNATASSPARDRDASAPTTARIDPEEVARQRRLLAEAKRAMAQVEAQRSVLRTQIAAKMHGVAGIAAEIADLDRLVQSVATKESKVAREAGELRSQLRSALVKCFDSRIIAEVLLMIPEADVRALRCTCAYYSYNVTPPLDCPGFREKVEW